MSKSPSASNGFGDEVYAVSDGIISKVHENIKENVPPTLPVPQLPLNDIAGNHVIIKIQQYGKTYYVLNAHMQPGSIRVKEGDHVKKGQVIGLLGNTGNSSAPHLHLHVCDANDPLKCEGVPFVLEKANVIGSVDEIIGDYGIWTTIKPLAKKNTKQLVPLDNQVFYFSNQLPKKCP
ncbi:MAG TPA: M23 family metallopeptidase [Candidatus Berkiella sp.]|nr:M23 family metallopeptidase [Candidatus Berkiella sp.]